MSGNLAVSTINGKNVDSFKIPVRQTVLSGTVGTNGFSSFGGSTGSTTVTASSTLVATCADGIDDRIGTIVNPSWAGLSTNGTMYLYLDIATNGTCITGSVATLEPIYRWGGADIVTNGQWTYNIQEGKGRVGNGVTASQVYRVFVGEVDVAGGVVTGITWYALMGRAIVTQSSLSVSTSYILSHNIGINFSLNVYGWFECTIADQGFNVGDKANALTTCGSNIDNYGTKIYSSNSKTLFIRTATIGVHAVFNKTTFAPVTITPASWKLYYNISRGW